MNHRDDGRDPVGLRAHDLHDERGRGDGSPRLCQVHPHGFCEQNCGFDTDFAAVEGKGASRIGLLRLCQARIMIFGRFGGSGPSLWPISRISIFFLIWCALEERKNRLFLRPLCCTQLPTFVSIVFWCLCECSFFCCYFLLCDFGCAQSPL